MSQLCRRSLKIAVVLSLFTMAVAPTMSPARPAPVATAATGPTLPPLPWCGLTGPTLPPLPWDGIA